MSEATRERVSVKYEYLSKKFSDPAPDYDKQYCAIYLARLKETEIYLRERIQNKWGARFPICKLYRLAQEHYDKCIVMGTFFKDQKLKPSILKQLGEAHHLTPQPILHHFTDDSDKLYMEDEMQRYELLGVLDGKNLVTGITCALLGSDMGKGKFMVEDYLYAGYRPQVERPLLSNDVYVIFLSGIDFINHQNFISNLELFTNWISGMLGDEDTVSRISRVIIAGNSIRTEVERQRLTMMLTSRRKESSEVIEAVKSFDYFLLQLCELVDIDVMPGEHDPSNHILPQKPMHHCMFPQSAIYKSTNFVPNPYFCSLDDVKVFGTAGQPVRDIMRFCEITDPLEALECCLKWGHLAPTAPDSLGCYPFYESDPFVFDDCPHVFFAGNQPKFATKMAQGEDGQQVRLICIPEFCSSFQAVVLNLKNLDCTSMVFTTCK